MLNLRSMSERLCIAGLARAATLLFACAVAFGVLGCEKEPEPPVDHSAILYKGVRPIEVGESAATAADGIAALERRINLRYPMMVGDTLNVCILEFKSDVYAMDYYTNSGRFQGLTPILRKVK